MVTTAQTGACSPSVQTLNQWMLNLWITLEISISISTCDGDYYFYHIWGWVAKVNDAEARTLSRLLCASFNIHI